ncbi:ABC transporter permease [Actinomadura sp. B10D3]|uniref:ABC transporter permease n=1 Tax=Actinomadura sp. B10D3 TaxID=3153557 RepID=UPI00325CFABE
MSTGGWARAGLRWAWPLASAVLALAVLHLAVVTGALPSRYFPDVPELLGAFGTALGTGVFWTAVLNTARSTAVGFALAALIAVPTGVLVGRSDVLFHATRFIIEFLRPIPVVAIIPLVVLLYGTGFEATLFLVAFAAVFPILLQTVYGVRDTDPVALDTARSFRLGRLREFLVVVLPSALPFVVTGLRISASLALLVALSTEIVIGAPGLGQQIVLAQSGNATAQMYALILAAGLLGVLFNGLLARAAGMAAPWAAQRRGDES